MELSKLLGKYKPKKIVRILKWTDEMVVIIFFLYMSIHFFQVAVTFEVYFKLDQ